MKYSLQICKKFYSNFYKLKIELLQTVLSNFEKNAAPKYSAFGWVACSTLIGYHDICMQNNNKFDLPSMEMWFSISNNCGVRLCEQDVILIKKVMGIDYCHSMWGSFSQNEIGQRMGMGQRKDMDGVLNYNYLRWSKTGISSILLLVGDDGV